LEAADSFYAGVADLIHQESLAWHEAAALVKYARWQTGRRGYVVRWREQAGELLREAAVAW
jgi:hypothetical protein